MLMRNLGSGILRLLGVALAVISCIPMLTMLPAGITVMLSLVGLSIAPMAAWAAPLVPFAPFLFGLSIVFLVVGHLRCGWQPASVVALGGALVYLAMYVVVTPLADHAMTSPAMPGMTEAMPADTAIPGMAGLTNAPLFYAGPSVTT